MGQYEKEKGFASYKTIVDYFIGECVLVNKIIKIDASVCYNMVGIEDNDEIYQYYICNIGRWEKEQAQKAGLILSYSEVLECDVLCVNHYGTSWDYVLTDVKLFDTWEELEMYEKEV